MTLIILPSGTVLANDYTLAITPTKDSNVN